MERNDINITTIDTKSFKKYVLQSSMPVLVEFRSEWSGSCHIIETPLNSLAIEFSKKIAFYQVDIDKCPDLAGKFGVSSVPTVLFYRGGKVVDHLVGTNSKEVYRSKIVDVLLNISF